MLSNKSVLRKIAKENKEKARANGDARFFHPIACPNGHHEKYTRDNKCVGCHQERKRDRRRNNSVINNPRLQAKRLARANRKNALANGEKTYYHPWPCKCGHHIKDSIKQFCIQCSRDSLRKLKPMRVTSKKREARRKSHLQFLASVFPEEYEKKIRKIRANKNLAKKKFLAKMMVENPKKYRELQVRKNIRRKEKRKKYSCGRRRKRKPSPREIVQMLVSGGLKDAT